MGTGTEDIVNLCKDKGLKSPEYHQEEDFRVVIWRRTGNVEGNVTGNAAGSVAGNVASNVKRIVLTIGMDTLTRDEIMQRLGLKGSGNFRAKYLYPAIEQGYAALGFTDHTPWPYANGYVSRIRMDVEQLGDYVASIRALKEKYRGRIELFIGLECEPFPQYYPWLRDMKEKYQLDYLILGNHVSQEDEAGHFYMRSQTRDDLKRYTESTLQGMESGLFTYLAHPEVSWSDYPQVDDACMDMAEAICREARRLNMPLEYNLLGNDYRETQRTHGLGYPHDAFWEVAARHGNAGIVGIDAHRPEMLTWTGKVIAAQEHLRALGVQVIDQLEL